MRRPWAFGFLFPLLLARGPEPALAATTFLDLSRAADMGPAQSFDGAVTGGEDLKEKEGLANIPQGPQTLRGVPFLLLDSTQNQGRSFVVLKGKRQAGFPQAVAVSAGDLRAGYLYFLHSCRWGGTAPNVTVAEYDVIYGDGQVEVIPLRVGMEITNFTGADDTPASDLAWWHKYKNTDMGISLFPWQNPRPDVPIQTILFKSLGKMPVPMLFAITASDTALPVSPVSPKPEKTFQTDTRGWIPFQPPEGFPAGTAIDMSSLLDPPAGKHGALMAQNGKLVFGDRTKARFWGTRLADDWWNLTDEQLSQIADRLAVDGCDLLAVKDTPNSAVTGRLEALAQILKPKGIYLDLTQLDPTQVPADLAGDPAVLAPPGPWTCGKAFPNEPPGSPSEPLTFEDSPMVLRPEESIPFRLITGRSLGVPFRAQWGVGWPNEYLGEGPLLTSAYGDFEDWGACVGMGMGPEEEGTVLGPGPDLNDKPMLSAQWPVAALVYLRGDLEQGRFYDLETPGSPMDMAGALQALAHYSGIRGERDGFKTDAAGLLKAKLQPKIKSFVSDSGQIAWRGNVGLIQISSPRFQAIIGFLGHQKLASPVWQVESPNFFASLSLVSLTKTNLWASDHMLLTGAARMENTGQVYNADKTKLISAGKAPILMEPFQAKIALFRYKADPQLRVRALDVNGQVLKTKVHFKWAKNNLVFSWIPGAFYLEIYKAKK